MNFNPYESPAQAAYVATAKLVEDPERRRLVRLIRADLVLLLIGGLYNFLMFTPGPDYSPSLLFWLVPTAFNFALIFAISTFVWFRGLNVLEWIARMVRSLSKRRINEEAWLEALYEGVRLSPACAAGGMIVWAAWVWAFYVVRLDFMLVSIPTAIIAHGLGALFYVPIFVRWYRIWRSSSL